MSEERVVPDSAANEQLEAQKKTERMGTASIGRLLLEFSIPCIAMNVFNSLYNLVDAAFLGIAFPDGSGVAVTTLAMPVQSILFGFSMLAGVGGSALAAIQLGRRDQQLVEKTLGNTTVLLIVIAGAVALTAGFFIDQILGLVGTPAELWESTRTFLSIICLFFVFQSLGGGLNNFLRSAGMPNFAFVTSALGTVICILLNYLFVLVFRWGVAGSAWATILGQACGMVPVLIYFIAYRKAAFRLHLSCMKPDGKLMLQIMSLGFASFVTQMAASLVNVVFNHVVGMYGAQDPMGAPAALGSIGVAQRISWFALMPIMGIMFGSQPLIGYNYGAKNWQRVLDSLKWACVAGAVTGACFTLICELFAEPIVALFGIDEELAAFAAIALRIYVIWFAGVGYQVVGSSYFQSSGQPLKATILELTRQIIFLIPLYLLLPPVLTQLFGMSGLMGVIICVPASDILAFITTTIFIVIEVRKLRALRDGQTIEEPAEG